MASQKETFTARSRQAAPSFVCAIGDELGNIHRQARIPTRDPVSTLAAVQGFLRAGSQMVGGIAAIGIGCYVVAPGLPWPSRYSRGFGAGHGRSVLRPKPISFRDRSCNFYSTGPFPPPNSREISCAASTTRPTVFPRPIANERSSRKVRSRRRRRCRTE